MLQLIPHVNKLDILEEMDKFLKVYSLPRPNQDEIENPNRLITSKEIERVIKILPTSKSPGPDSFPGEFYQTFIESVSILFKLFQKFKKKKLFQTHFMRPVLF